MMKKQNNEGMSLVSVMIAAGLMGILAVFMMKMQENQLKTQNDMEARGEINQLLNTLVNTMAKPGYCQSSLKGQVIDPTKIILKKIIAPNGHVLFEVGQKYGNRTITLKEIREKEFHYDSTDKSSGYLTFDIAFEKNKKAFGAKVIHRKMMVLVQLDNQRIVDCSTLGGGMAMGATGSGPQIDMKAVEAVSKGVATKDESDSINSKEREVKKIIENNEQLRLMQEAIRNLDTANKKFEDLSEE